VRIHETNKFPRVIKWHSEFSRYLYDYVTFQSRVFITFVIIQIFCRIYLSNKTTVLQTPISVVRCFIRVIQFSWEEYPKQYTQLKNIANLLIFFYGLAVDICREYGFAEVFFFFLSAILYFLIFFTSFDVLNNVLGMRWYNFNLTKTIKWLL